MPGLCADELVAQVERTNSVLLIPTPVLFGFLIGAEPERFQQYLDGINGSACLELVDFDAAAAVECALLPSRQELAQLSPDEAASKLKYGRQIVSIALASVADEVWSHDKPLRKLAESRGLAVKSLADIEPSATQSPLHDD
ncbi:hypothetical protein KO507_18240 [Gilvimarinus agarilyticus]|uniref:hypothetical protein n=1 Tax=Gilvimarinus sp. 2_MG-2023 TaxID=3062666 RepID=UPI001C08A28D|nr:hypothetical protein [Gilvimarinus sp. 2_MG-2023]MBU2887710.1 hypothetical protein [Gilvimarinus agarilyticus]MDO6572357.1 hypothetical protein [Gilvimarinus sp. 2_MG-2023]